MSEHTDRGKLADAARISYSGRGIGGIGKRGGRVIAACRTRETAVVVAQRRYAIARQPIGHHSKRTMGKNLLIAVLKPAAAHKHYERNTRRAVGSGPRESSAQHRIAGIYRDVFDRIRERSLRSLRTTHGRRARLECKRECISALSESADNGALPHLARKTRVKSRHFHHKAVGSAQSEFGRKAGGALVRRVKGAGAVDADVEHHAQSL